MVPPRLHRLGLAALLTVSTPALFAAESSRVDAKSAFERMKSLAGSWGGTAGGAPATVEYRVASGGSVVMETILPGTEHEMISMYHLDGDDLVMVHYCSAGNQPKLRMDPAASTADVLRFEYVSGTNVVPERDGHIHAGVFTFRSDGGLEEDWSFWQGGKEAGVNRFVLRRAGG